MPFKHNIHYDRPITTPETGRLPGNYPNGLLQQAIIIDQVMSWCEDNGLELSPTTPLKQISYSLRGELSSRSLSRAKHLNSLRIL